MSAQRAPQRAFRSTRLLSLVPLSLVALFGCASIIGLDEYTVAGNAGGSGGQSGSAGHAGAISSGGSAGEAGTVEMGGDTSAAGAAGSSAAGAAGETSMPPTIVGCDGVTPFTPDEQLVRSCLLRAGCDPNSTPIRTISTCVTKNTQAALPGESCNLTSKTCADYEACEHVGVAHDDLCGGSKKTRCENNKAINCGNYLSGDRFFDCDGLGGTCATYTYGSSNTVYSDCKQDIAPESCVGYSDDTLFYCHDDVRYYCWKDEAYGSTCAPFASCSGDPAAGDAGCYFKLPKCTGADSTTCSDGVANVCSSGDLFKYDCAGGGLSCAVTAGTEYCLAPGCKAADVDTKCTEKCSDDGSQLTFCYGGAPYTVTCTDYGFTQCLADQDADGNPFAACRF